MDTLSTILLVCTITYMLISVIIESLTIYFLITPSEKDDPIGFYLLQKWESVSKYARWLSIRTPVLVLVELLITLLSVFREKLHLDVLRKRNKTNTHTGD